jgi:hypothetical protein
MGGRPVVGLVPLTPVGLDLDRWIESSGMNVGVGCLSWIPVTRVTSGSRFNHRDHSAPVAPFSISCPSKMVDSAVPSRRRPHLPGFHVTNLINIDAEWGRSVSTTGAGMNSSADWPPSGPGHYIIEKRRPSPQRTSLENIGISGASYRGWSISPFSGDHRRRVEGLPSRHSARARKVLEEGP